MLAITIFSLGYIIVYGLWKFWEQCVEEGKKASARGQPFFRRFSLAEIKSATKNFDAGCVIGEGGFGKVYKGSINNGRETIAMKRLKFSSNQGEPEFLAEIEMLSKLRHNNLVSLIGYCEEPGEMILVYEYMTRGSLADHLHNKISKDKKDNSSLLSWTQRLNICIGAGRGVDYLHTGNGIIHRDIKSSNILLDDDFGAKVSDFGLAKTEKKSKSQSHVTTKVKGTRGYLDPYYRGTHKLRRKSDTYSFGVLLLEVLCGKRAAEGNRYLTTWAQEHIRNGEVEKIISSDLSGKISAVSLKIFVRVAESCLDDEPNKRPTMGQVVTQLELALEQQKSNSSNVQNVFTWDVIRKRAELSTLGHLKASITEDCETNIRLIVFDWLTILNATNEFSSSNIVGRNPSGIFYQAALPTGGVVAIKKISTSNAGDVVEMFMNEFSRLSKLQHPNIMKLIGYSSERDVLLAYEYVRDINASLEVILFERSNDLPWMPRFKIIMGIARGLAYLHGDLDLRKLYCHLKPCNIFLDAEMNPKIAFDFEHRNEEIGSSPNFVINNYATPESCSSEPISIKSDIYIFGIMVLEILSGRRHCLSTGNQNIITTARKLCYSKRTLHLMDPYLGRDFVKEEAMRCIQIGLLCTQEEPGDRPWMPEVVKRLKGDLTRVQGSAKRSTQVPLTITEIDY